MYLYFFSKFNWQFNSQQFYASTMEHVNMILKKSMEDQEAGKSKQECPLITV